MIWIFFVCRKNIKLIQKPLILLKNRRSPLVLYKQILQKNAIRNVCGVAILVGKRLHGFKIKEHDTNFNSLKYNVMHISIEAEETVGIVNVYAPVQENATEKLGFFQDLENIYLKLKNKN